MRNDELRRRARRSAIGLLLAGVVTGLAPQPVETQPFGPPFSITQITNSTGGDGLSNLNASINAAGTRIAFASTRDLTPGNPGNFDGGHDIFLFDTTTGLITQITNTTGGRTSFGPSINAAGTRIAFVSSGDLTPGSPGNADGNFEVFLFDTTTGLFTQITNTTGGNLFFVPPSINAAGTRIAFGSDRDLTPGSPGNPDGNVEIFLYDTTTGVFTQITNSTGGPPGGAANSDPSINAAGTRIAFESDRDLTPGSPGNADGNRELFLFDTSTGLKQITNTTGFSNALQPSINAAGTRIAFSSNRDLTPGNPGNADGSNEIFVFDTTTNLFTQITNSPGGSFAPSINADGTAEIFVVDTTTGLFIQLTNTTSNFNLQPAINADGTRIAFSSIDDLTPGRPGNADGNLELFLATITFPAVAQGIPTLSTWIQLAVAALLLASGIVALRRGGVQTGPTRS